MIVYLLVINSERCIRNSIRIWVRISIKVYFWLRFTNTNIQFPRIDDIHLFGTFSQLMTFIFWRCETRLDSLTEKNRRKLTWSPLRATVSVYINNKEGKTGLHFFEKLLKWLPLAFPSMTFRMTCPSFLFWLTLMKSTSHKITARKVRSVFF